MSLLLCLPLTAQAADVTTMVMQALARAPDRQAHFTEDKHLAAIDGALTSSGILAYRHPDQLEKRTLSPEPETLTIAGDQLTIAIAGQPLRVVPFTAEPALRVLATALRAPMQGDLTSLTGLFTVQTGGTLDAWRMRLQPSARPAARVLREVTIDGRRDRIVQVFTVQANGDTDTLRITP